jgi:hypothetical protein
MADWLVGTYILVMLLVITFSASMALLNKDAARRKDAYKVLRLLVTTGAASGLISLLVKLHEIGLLH